MERNQKIVSGVVIAIVIVGSLVIYASQDFPESTGDLTDFPDFFTKNENYFVTRIGSVPNIDRDLYRLEVFGLVDNPTIFTLDELQALNLTELPLTIECIGNGQNSQLVGTALWKGFNVYDLLLSLGISENATGVKYHAADDYYSSHTLDQVQNNGVLGALYMNGEEISPLQGFPLRILNPGYYGIKQPAWVIGIEVIDRPLEEYWEDRGWDTAPPMDIDSKIFFPRTATSISENENLRVGGCAFGGTRVAYVEYTTNSGASWDNATIVQQIDADNVWVFWEINLSFDDADEYQLYIRAVDINGIKQPRTDTTFLDGTNNWPVLYINVS
jgi:hypothetical protein